ncbi:MAG TPA: TadG family pilus assembly protein, partial [Negativicutes bacterium]|nr:TadG family pilus assembly protein [Negativicutes bacterium]
EKGKLQNTVDSAALAAISQYSKGQESMLSEAYKYSNLNGFPAEELGIEISESNRRITVSANKSVSLFFARMFGKSSADVSAKATAIAGPITAVKGIKPFGVEMQEFIFATPYDLKEGGGEGNTGNYGALALGGSGASNYRTNLINGYDDSVLRVGEVIETEPGNMNGPTLDGIRAILDSDSHSHSADLSSLEVG